MHFMHFVHFNSTSRHESARNAQNAMVKTYRYAYDGGPGSPNKKHTCPACGQKMKFRRFFDYENKVYLANNVGTCDRINKCGYHFTPKEYFAINPMNRTEAFFPAVKTLRHEINTEKDVVHIPCEILKQTLCDYENNSFIKPLLKIFPTHKIEEAIGKYYLGTITSTFNIESNSDSSVVFWFIDRQKNIRAGQVKLFDNNCKTLVISLKDNEKIPCITWVHSLELKKYKCEEKEAPNWLTNYSTSEKVTCFFGEHLLAKNSNRTVALVEAPKTAFIASMVYPEYLWIATGGLSYLTEDRCQSIRGRKVLLFPDASLPNKISGKTCFQLWKERIDKFKHIADFKIADILEKNASEDDRRLGFDLADYILRDCTTKSLNLTTANLILQMQTFTGKMFNDLILVYVKGSEGYAYDILYNNNGDLITTDEKLEGLSKFYNKSFLPAKLDGIDCLINIITNENTTDNYSINK